MSKFMTLLALLGMLVVTACGGGGTAPGTGATRASAAAEPTSTATAPATTSAGVTATPRPSPTLAPGPRWPVRDVSVPYRGTVPPVPRLTAIRVGTHPDGGYDRIAMEFDALPGYRAGYRSTIVRDGSGEPVRLPGKACLQIVFDPAQAHDDSGNSTLPRRPDQPVTVSYPAVRAYVLNGDFEGYVSVALGVAGRVGFRVGGYRATNGHHVVYVDLARP